MQAFPPTMLPPPATKPDCLVWYPGDPCDQQIQLYHQALEQRQQQEWQNSVTARFEKQISEQQKQIADQQIQLKTLQSKIESQTMEALRSEAQHQAFLDGIGVIIGTSLAFFVVVAIFRKFVRNSTVPTHEQSRAASA